MLKRIETPGGRKVAFTFEGRRVEAFENDTVASALLATGEVVFRSTPVSGAARGPYCMMGVCFECLVEIDGMPNRQACMIAVAEGIQVRRQEGAAKVEPV